MEVCCSGFERAGSSRELWRRKFGVGGGCPFFVGGGRAMGWRDLGGGCCGRGGVGWDDGWRLDGMGWDGIGSCGCWCVKTEVLAAKRVE